MRRSRPGRAGARGQAVGVLVVLAVAVGGCGGPDAEPDGAATTDGSATPTTSATGPSAETTAASPDPESTAPTAPTDPAVAPATGSALEIEVVALNLPAGGEVVSPGTFSEAGFEPGGSGSVTVVGGPTGGTATLEFEADGALDTATADGLEPQRLDNRTVAGSEGWVITGSSKELALQYQFGTIVNGNSIVISVRWERSPPADAQQIIDSILATVTYPS